jgi:hypothetical protein
MKMIECEKIKLETLVHHDLSMRFVAEEIFEDISHKNVSKVMMDFKNIRFMSRSFAQEYIYRKNKLNIEIIEKNMNKDVEKMFNVVLKSIKK